MSFDFCNEYFEVRLNEKGQFPEKKEIRIERKDDYVLNGIRLFSLFR